MSKEVKEFTEDQRFKQWWLWVILLGLLLFFIYAFLQQALLGKPVGDNPMSNWGLGLTIVLILAFIFTMASMQLRTTITKKEILVNFGPFGKHKYQWNDIRKADVFRYGFVGYGYRRTKKHGTVFNISGQTGLQLEFKDGQKVTIGTQQPEELRQFLKSIQKL